MLTLSIMLIFHIHIGYVASLPLQIILLPNVSIGDVADVWWIKGRRRYIGHRLASSSTFGASRTKSLESSPSRLNFYEQ